MADGGRRAKTGRLPDGTFAPGNRINPRGRPAGSRNRATVILDEIAAGGAEEVVRKVVEAAKGGDMRAAEVLLSRAWPARKSRLLNLSLPAIETAAGVSSALAAVIQAVAAGELSPDEAAPVGALLESQRRAIETTDLEERLQRLEDRLED